MEKLLILGEKVNVLKELNTDSEILLTLEHGNIVNLEDLKKLNGIWWLKITYENSIIGYIKGNEYVTPLIAFELSDQKTKIFLSPDNDSKVFNNIKTNDKFLLQGQVKDSKGKIWNSVQFNSEKGYLCPKTKVLTIGYAMKVEKGKKIRNISFVLSIGLLITLFTLFHFENNSSNLIFNAIQVMGQAAVVYIGIYILISFIYRFLNSPQETYYINLMNYYKSRVLKFHD